MELDWRAPERMDLDDVRCWRKQDPQVYRTSHLLTAAHQDRFWEALNAPNALMRFWTIWDKERQFRIVQAGYGICELASHSSAFAGLENIQWENRRAELSLIVAPDERRKGIGRAVLGELIRRAWEEVGLDWLEVEVYDCSPYQAWIGNFFEEEDGSGICAHPVRLPSRKFWKGRYWDSMLWTLEEPTEEVPCASPS